MRAVCLLAFTCLCLSVAAQADRYSDDFSSYRDPEGLAVHWDCMTPTWSVHEGVLEQTDASLYGTYAFLRDPVFADFRLSVRFLIDPATGSIRAPGLAFRSPCSREGYYVHYDSAGSQVLFQIMRPGANGNEVDLKRVGGVAIAPGVWHEGQVRAVGDQFRVYLDGRLVLEVADDTFPAGRVGLRAGYGRISFDDFSVSGTRGQLAREWRMNPMPDNMKHLTPPARTVRNAERIVAVRGQGYFPVLIKMADGTLGAVIRGGAPHIGRGGRLDFIRSSDGGRTWSDPVVAVDSEWDDRNPALGQMPDGTLVLAYGEAQSYRPDGTFDLEAGPYLPCLVTSNDGGRTWSPKREFWAPFTSPSPYGKITVCRNGTALMVIYQMPSNAVGILRSTDNGRTWGDYSPLPGHDETQVIELPDGRLMAFTRMEGSSGHGLLLSESSDEGRTWGNTWELMKAQQWPFDATVLQSGHLLLSYGSRLDHFGAGVVLSRDGGKTWDEARATFLGWDSLNTDTGYPSTVQLDDGTIVTMYYAVGTAQSPDEQALVVRYHEDDLR